MRIALPARLSFDLILVCKLVPRCMGSFVLTLFTFSPEAIAYQCVSKE